MPPTEDSLASTVPDLRVARVTAARAHPNADRLLVMEIDLGGDRRRIVAGLVGHYEPGELEGAHIVVVANLEPARLRGEISEGMLLAAESGGRLGILLAPGAEPGTRLTAESGAEPAESITFDEFTAHELTAAPEGVTLDGSPLRGAELRMDREVYGTLR